MSGAHHAEWFRALDVSQRCGSYLPQLTDHPGAGGYFSRNWAALNALHYWLSEKAFISVAVLQCRLLNTDRPPCVSCMFALCDLGLTFAFLPYCGTVCDVDILS